MERVANQMVSNSRLLHNISLKYPGRLPKAPRVPIWLQLATSAVLVVAVSISVFSYLIMERQQSRLYDNTVQLGTVSLYYIAQNSKMPLLASDSLTLNTQISQSTSVDGLLYSLIVDNKGLVAAHTDHTKIGKSYHSQFIGTKATHLKGRVTSFNYQRKDGSQILDLSMPILFQGKKLGEAHVGLSTDFIKNLYINERAFLASLSLVFIFISLFTATLYGLRFSRPISKLVEATRQIGNGNYDHKVHINRNDELGMLSIAFNQMGTELSRQSMMRESFGKYIGPEILDMILEHPEQSWLKGKKCESSILFADIRGFTAYSESKKPEEIVVRLNELFEIITKVVIEHGGHVDKFIGDSVLAVFGVPTAKPGHLKQCIAAAIDIQKRLAAASGNGNTLLDTIGIGISSGEVVAGNIGSQTKMEYTVIGDAVNVAAYVNTLAGPGEIIVCCDGEDELRGFSGVKHLPAQRVKKRECMVNLFQIPWTDNSTRCQRGK